MSLLRECGGREMRYAAFLSPLRHTQCTLQATRTMDALAALARLSWVHVGRRDASGRWHARTRVALPRGQDSLERTLTCPAIRFRVARLPAPSARGQSGAVQASVQDPHGRQPRVWPHLAAEPNEPARARRRRRLAEAARRRGPEGRLGGSDGARGEAAGVRGAGKGRIKGPVAGVWRQCQLVCRAG
jgi:hypothetical protein